MIYIQGYFDPIKLSYTEGFLVFWALMLVAYLGLCIAEYHWGEASNKFESSLFWAFGSAMVIFAAERSIGLARDDFGYIAIYDTLCPSLSCGQFIQGQRDAGWYFLIGLLKSLFHDPRIMFWLSALGLLVKLTIIYSIVKRPFPVLLLYTAIYYQIQDLTALRASLVITVFMLAIWLFLQNKKLYGLTALFSCGIFHQQGFVAPMILFGDFFKTNYYALFLICFLSIIFLTFGFYPRLDIIIPKFGAWFQDLVFNERFENYLDDKKVSADFGFKNAPIVVYPQIFFIFWLLIRSHMMGEKLNSLLIGCLLMGCLFLWGFGSLPVMQVRFFEFFMVPTLLLAGFHRLRWFEILGLITVAALFVAKYNIVNKIFVQT